MNEHDLSMDENTERFYLICISSSSFFAILYLTHSMEMILQLCTLITPPRTVPYVPVQVV